MRVNGGLVKDALPFPLKAGRIEARGIWSGGQWSPQKKLLLYQYRDHLPLGIWQMVGINRLSGHFDMSLILVPLKENAGLSKDDVLIFGNGFYTILPIYETTLPSDKDCSIEIGHHHAIALFSKVPSQIMIFHKELTLEFLKENWQPVWWRGQEFSIRISSSFEEIRRQESVSNRFYAKAGLQPAS